jgi:hypothetical protein
LLADYFPATYWTFHRNNRSQFVLSLHASVFASALHVIQQVLCTQLKPQLKATFYPVSVIRCPPRHASNIGVIFQGFKRPIYSAAAGYQPSLPSLTMQPSASAKE